VQVGAGFQQMGGIAMAQTVRADSLVNTCSPDRPATCVPDCFRCERDIDFEMYELGAAAGPSNTTS